MQVSTTRGPLLPGEQRHNITLADILSDLPPIDSDISPADTAAGIRASVRLGALDEIADWLADSSEISGNHEAVLAAEQRTREAMQALERAALELAAALDTIAD